MGDEDGGKKQHSLEELDTVRTSEEHMMPDTLSHDGKFHTIRNKKKNLVKYVHEFMWSGFYWDTGAFHFISQPAAFTVLINKIKAT